MRQIRGQRQRYPDQVYDLAEALLSEGAEAPTAQAIADALEAELPADSEKPHPRTIRDWIQKGVIKRRTDLWTLGSAEPGQAAAVLPVLSAVAVRNRRISAAIDRRIRPPLVSIDEARILTLLTEAGGALDPVIRFELARYYAAVARAGLSTGWLDIFVGHLVAFEVWDEGGLKRLEDAIAERLVDPVPGWPGQGLRETEGLYSAIQNGIQRRNAQ